MRGLGAKLTSFLWWNYPRGSLEYDIMVGIILAFIFLTPRHFFRDQPRAAAPPGSGFARSAPAPPRVQLAALPGMPRP